MRAKGKFLWGVVIVLLSGCIQPVYDETTQVPEATLVSTPLIPFELSPAATQPPGGPPSLYLQPSVVELTVGGTDVVSVWVDNVQQLNDLLVELSFDPDYVRVEDGDPQAEGVQIGVGEFFHSAEILQNQVAGEGRVAYHVALGPGATVGGSGVVASITLRGVAEGGSPLRFESIAALDPQGQDLEVMPLSDGIIIVGGAIPSETPLPTPLVTAQPTVPSAQGSTTRPTPAPALGGIYYVVQPGENLFRIGLKFGATAQAIAAASGIADPRQVAAGMMVLVPVAPPRGTYGYYVQPQDTVYSIAQCLGKTVSELAALNGLGPDYSIEVGQILVVAP